MKYTTNRIMNVRTLKKLTNNEGVTLRNGKIITYRSGWQVAKAGFECHTVEQAMERVHWLSKYGKELGGRNVGIWLSDGVYYVDICNRISTKKEAVEVGHKHDQLSIFYWGKRKEALEWL